MTRWCAVVVAVAMLSGCREEPEPTHKGRPLSALVALTRDADHDTSLAACRDLVEFYLSGAQGDHAKGALLQLLDDISPFKAVAVARATFIIDRDRTVARLTRVIEVPENYVLATAVADAVATQPRAVRERLLPAAQKSLATAGKNERKRWEALVAALNAP